MADEEEPNRELPNTELDSESSPPEPESLDLFSQMQEAARVSHEDDGDEDEGVSLEELSASYHQVLRNSDLEVDEVAEDFEQDTSNAPESETEDEEDESPESDSDDAAISVTPTAIVETLLFVGRPDSGGITSKEIAKTMRGVSAKEVERMIDDLNKGYERSERAVRIIERHDGFHLDLAPNLEHIRDRFYGQVREVSLSQAAIDCLALVAYQPGISREKLEDQRGQPSSGVLNQLVRRQLLEMKREQQGKVKQACYYPAEKMLQLTGLYSFEDLPQVHDLDTA
ncbi:MAG: SMC-Scp complex subunit ScpB [Pirellulaceae bacterium]